MRHYNNLLSAILSAKSTLYMATYKVLLCITYIMEAPKNCIKQFFSINLVI